MIEIIKELPLMIAIISIAWLTIIVLTLKDVFKRTDINNSAKIIWIAVGLIPLVGLLTYGFINYKRNKSILIGTIIATIISATAFWYFAIYEQEKNRIDVTNKQAITKTATQFVQEFLDNEDAANKKYLQKDSSIIEISGEVEKLESDEMGTVIYLKTNIEGTVISCRLQDKVTVQNGSTITVKGIFTGFIMGQIQLSECKLITAQNNTTPTNTSSAKPTPTDTTATTQPITKDTAKATAVVAKNYTSSKGQIKFFSKTAAEDIQATNTQIVSKISSKGDIEFAALIKGFRFENELMQKHFNEEGYLHSDKYPKSQFKGTITNFNAINLIKDGTYKATTTGNLTLHGVTKPITATGTITVKNGKLQLNSLFKLRVQDYNIDGSDVAEQLDITVTAEYQ
ncbi:MAG: YceI family protein [Chitinophagaceae bacterium]|jgi:polyisoprenoid-binding protein YceI|nr:YceI family protein [Chitinophagaceae bacterium]